MHKVIKGTAKHGARITFATIGSAFAGFAYEQGRKIGKKTEPEVPSWVVTRFGAIPAVAALLQGYEGLKQQKEDRE